MKKKKKKKDKNELPNPDKSYPMTVEQKKVFDQMIKKVMSYKVDPNKPITNKDLRKMVRKKK